MKFEQVTDEMLDNVGPLTKLDVLREIEDAGGRFLSAVEKNLADELVAAGLAERRGCESEWKALGPYDVTQAGWKALRAGVQL